MINTKFMNKIKKILIFTLIAGFAFNTNAQDQGTVSETVTTTAIVITPITIDGANTMNFGTMSINGAGGTLALSTEGSLSPTGGVDAIGTGGVAGTVDVHGVIGSTFTMTVRETTMLRTGSLTNDIIGVNVMPLSAFTIKNNTVALSSGGTASGASIDATNNNKFTGASAVFASATIGADGDSAILIGATITLTTGQTVGTYAGAITVDVAYD